MGLFSPERPTRAELDQQRQETQEEQTQVLFKDKDNTQEDMDTALNLKRKPLAKVDLCLTLGQSPKPRRSPKHKRQKEKI